MSLGKIIDKKNYDLSKRIDKKKVPEHVAIIMDGNGRWATQKGFPRSFGHNEGVSVLKEIIKVSKKIGCKETEVKWELLPQMKLKTIENLKINNKVAMVGDGINDVPALASSDLGIAVGSGTQIAKANADVVLMGDQLNGLPYALNLAKKTIRKIKQNLIWAFGYNLLAIPLAAGILFPKYGILLTPSIAALLMAISSITVVINALSLD